MIQTHTHLIEKYGVRARQAARAVHLIGQHVHIGGDGGDRIHGAREEGHEPEREVRLPRREPGLRAQREPDGREALEREDAHSVARHLLAPRPYVLPQLTREVALACDWPVERAAGQVAEPEVEERDERVLEE